MTPFDLSAEVTVLGQPPVTAKEFDVAVGAESLPRIGVGGTFLLPGKNPMFQPIVDVRAGLWHGEFDAALDYSATVLDVGADIGFRLLPFASAPGPSWVRPFADVGIGLRTWGLFQPWWEDELVLGSGAELALGAEIGEANRCFVVRARYHMDLGPRLRGVLDSALSDFKWTLDPAGGHLSVAVGYGWR